MHGRCSPARQDLAQIPVVSNCYESGQDSRISREAGESLVGCSAVQLPWEHILPGRGQVSCRSGTRVHDLSWCGPPCHMAGEPGNAEFVQAAPWHAMKRSVGRQRRPANADPATASRPTPRPLACCAVRETRYLRDGPRPDRHSSPLPTEWMHRSVHGRKLPASTRRKR